MSSLKRAKKAQDRKQQEERLATQEPPQHNARAAATMGAIIGAVMGHIGGIWCYEATHYLDPSWTDYPRIVVLNWHNIGAVISTMYSVVSLHPQSPNWAYWPAIGILLTAPVAGRVAWRAAFVPAERQLSGPRLVPPHKLPALARSEALGIHLGPVQLSRHEETENILIVGAPGTGKTTIVNSIVGQTVARGERIFAVDFKGDYRRLFPQAAFLAPWSKRSVRWRVGRDVRTLGHAVEFAYAFIPEGKKGGEAEESIWPKAARMVVVGVILHLINTKGENWSLGDLAEALRALNGKPDAIAKIIAPYRPFMAARLPMMAPETRESVYFNILPPAETILDLADLEAKHKERYWSIAEWLDGSQPFAILGWRESEREMTKQFALPMLLMLVQALLSDEHPEQPPEAPGFWIMVDEAGQLGTIHGFVHAWSALRSKGGRVVAGFQNFAQIRNFYGRESTAITGAGTRLIGVQRDPDEQEEAAKHAGKRVLQRYTATCSAEGEISYQWQITEEPVYRAARFAALGRMRDARGVKLLYLGRENSRSEIIFPFDNGASK